MCVILHGQGLWWTHSLPINGGRVFLVVFLEDVQQKKHTFSITYGTETKFLSAFFLLLLRSWEGSVTIEKEDRDRGGWMDGSHLKHAWQTTIVVTTLKVDVYCMLDNLYFTK